MGDRENEASNMSTVKDAYEAYRVTRPAPDLAPWDELGPTERAVLEVVARRAAADAVDAAIADFERLVELEADKTFAKIEADPTHKFVDRRRG
jgi:hypothetical protein